jgi:hypothetical protein
VCLAQVLQKQAAALDQQQLALVSMAAAPALHAWSFPQHWRNPREHALQVKQTTWSWARGAAQNGLPAFLRNKIAQNVACILQVSNLPGTFPAKHLLTSQEGCSPQGRVHAWNCHDRKPVLRMHMQLDFQAQWAALMALLGSGGAGAADMLCRVLVAIDEDIVSLDIPRSPQGVRASMEFKVCFDLTEPLLATALSL